MCPDPQLLSVYFDGELPSPWKEKMEAHLTECPVCMEKLNHYRQLFKNPVVLEQDITEAKDRVWQNLQSRRRFQPRGRSTHRSGFWQRKLSIPLPAAAAAAVIIMLMAALWLRDGQVTNDGFAYQHTDPADRAAFFIAAEDEMPGIMPTADINGILQFLASDGTEVIILSLPENRSFSRTGEPAIIRAADYQHNRGQRRHQ